MLWFQPTKLFSIFRAIIFQIYIGVHLNNTHLKIKFFFLSWRRIIYLDAITITLLQTFYPMVTNTVYSYRNLPFVGRIVQVQIACKHKVATSNCVDEISSQVRNINNDLRQYTSKKMMGNLLSWKQNPIHTTIQQAWLLLAWQFHKR